MSFEVQETDHGLGNIVTATGDISEREYVDFYTMCLSEQIKTHSNPVYNITDYTAVTKVTLSPAAIENIAKLSVEASGEHSSTIVAVVAKQDLIFGLTRMWENMAHRANWNINVFRDRKKAEAWILKTAKENNIRDDLTFA